MNLFRHALSGRRSKLYPIAAMAALLSSDAMLPAADKGGGESAYADSSATDRLIAQANACILAKDATGALKALEQALAFCPNNARLHLDRALQSHAKQDYLTAQTEVREAYRAYPLLGRIYYMSGYVRARSQDYYGAIQDLSISLYIDPSQLTQYLPRGQARFEVGDYAGAIEDFTILLKSNRPEFLALAYFNRGKARHELGDSEGALTDLTAAIGLSPYMLNEAYAYRSLQYLRQENLDAALQDATSAIAAAPRNPVHLNDRSWIYHLMGNTEAAHRDADAAIAIDRNFSGGWLARGTLHEAEDSRDLAIADYEKAVVLASEAGPKLWAYSCFLLDLLGRRTGRDEFRGYLADVLDWPESWPKRIALHLAGKISAESLERDARTTRDARARISHQCEAYYYIGMINLINGENEIARSYFERAVAMKQVTFVEYRLASAHLEKLK